MIIESMEVSGDNNSTPIFTEENMARRSPSAEERHDNSMEQKSEKRITSSSHSISSQSLGSGSQDSQSES